MSESPVWGSKRRCVPRLIEAIGAPPRSRLPSLPIRPGRDGGLGLTAAPADGGVALHRPARGVRPVIIAGKARFRPRSHPPTCRSRCWGRLTVSPGVAADFVTAPAGHLVVAEPDVRRRP